MTTTRTPVANRFQPIDPQPDALPMPNQTDKTLAQDCTQDIEAAAAVRPIWPDAGGESPRGRE